MVGGESERGKVMWVVPFTVLSPTFFSGKGGILGVRNKEGEKT